MLCNFVYDALAAASFRLRDHIHRVAAGLVVDDRPRLLRRMLALVCRNRFERDQHNYGRRMVASMPPWRLALLLLVGRAAVDVRRAGASVPISLILSR